MPQEGTTTFYYPPPLPQYSTLNAFAPTVVEPPAPIIQDDLIFRDQIERAFKVTGVQNLLNRYGQLPRVHGYVDNFKPPKAAQPYSLTIDGVSYLYALFCLGPGRLDVSNIKLGDKLVSTIAGASTQILEGAAAGETITLYKAKITKNAINVALPYNTYVQRKATVSGTELQIDVSCPNGLAQFDTAGSRSAATVQVDAEYSLNGTVWTHISPDSGAPSDPTFTITDNSLAPIMRTKIVTGLTNGTYFVRLKRTTADSTDTKLVNATNWDTLRIFDATPSVNPMKDVSGTVIPLSFIALKIKASELANGELAELSCTAKSYLQVWNGATWSSQLTNNPAWCYADVLTGPANRKFKALADLDAAGLLAWATFCTTNGYTFNYVWDGGDTVFNALKAIAMAGRASVFNNDGKFGIVIDQKQTTPVQVFSPLNTWDFKIEQYNPDIPHAYRIRFQNEKSSFKTDEMIVYDDGYNADGSNGYIAATRFETTQLVGVTNPDHVWKLGRYFIAQARLRRRKITFTTDIEHFRCQRFDMVLVSHYTAKFGLGRGRIKSTTVNGSGQTTTVTIDNQVTMVAGSTYCVRIRLSDFSFIKATLVTQPGTTTTLTFATPVTGTQPGAGDHLMFGFIDLETNEMLIDSFTHGDDKTATITCIDHAPAVYLAQNGTIPAFTSGVTDQVTPISTVPTPVIATIRTDESTLLRDVDGSLQSRIQVVLTSVPSEVQYVEAQMKLSSASTYAPAGIHPIGQGEIFLSPVQDRQTYDIQIRYISYTTKKSDWAQRTSIYITGKTSLPPDVPLVQQIKTGNSDPNDLGMLQWAYDAITLGQPVPKDLAGFRIKWNYGLNSNWAIGSLIANLVTGNQWDLNQLPGGAMTVMVKAVDTSGNESANPAILLKSFDMPNLSNVLKTTAHHPLWTLGTRTNATLSAGALIANDAGTAFWATDGNAKFYQPNDTALFWTYVSYLQMEYQWQEIVDPSYVVPTGCQLPEIVIGFGKTAEQFQLQYRPIGSSNLFWDKADSDQFYDSNDTVLFWDAQPPWQDFPGRLQTDVNTYDFKMVASASQTIQGRFDSLTVYYDVPNVIQTTTALSISTSGTRIPLTRAFRAINAVNAAWKPTTGVTYVAAPYLPVANDRDATNGPLIYLYDQTGTKVSGTIDATLVGD